MNADRLAALLTAAARATSAIAATATAVADVASSVSATAEALRSKLPVRGPLDRP